ncbi:calcium-dependent lipid-binding (CaLB domain) family protein [Actinidia rufa]|uniref:Calcium-dependent lipid-binding (CaLB domain) family protein n=1 Tax=Actinidia rufa TaxID=165716 RepID=A0A7J0FKV3_9ERIC|nr:calcium-dependent lipid-binding (CaLB domain) family protein [Actinidia rufa]
MESHQLEGLPNKSSVALEFPKAKNPSSIIVQSFGDLSKESRVYGKENVLGSREKSSIGVLEVYIHQAREIHNICIYHKQDVYAKISLTNDPETTASTQIINGGGKNPVFNESLRLNVGSIDSSLKCEIWMLSRVRNYLEDQLLGFALVSLSDVVIGNGKLEKEFSLSSSDLFHSPAGFVQLSLTYTGTSPEVLEIPTPRSSVVVPVSEEYFGVPYTDLDSKSTENLGLTNTNGKNPSSENTSTQIAEAVSMGGLDGVEGSKIETPPSSVSPTISSSKPPNQDDVSSLKENIAGASEAEIGSSALPASTLAQPLVRVNIEPKQEVVQQDIVDMYMKSMQESLAKMKLPLDIDNGPADSRDTSLDEKVPSSSKNDGRSPRVFYGSRAFF